MHVTAKVLVLGQTKKPKKDKDGKAEPSGECYYNVQLYGAGGESDSSSHDFGFRDPRFVPIIAGLCGKYAEVTINLREFKGVKQFDLVTIKGV